MLLASKDHSETMARKRNDGKISRMWMGQEIEDEDGDEDNGRA